jgi:hypothetical protein
MENSPLYKKLLKVQGEIGTIKKDSINPFFKSSYFDINSLLGTIKPILNKHGLLLLQPLDKDTLKTILIDTETGLSLESIVNLPVNTNPQLQGSIITYFRRYSLQSLLALEAEDDDANLGSNIGQEKSKQPIGKPVVKPPTPQLTIAQRFVNAKTTFAKADGNGGQFYEYLNSLGYEKETDVPADKAEHVLAEIHKAYQAFIKMLPKKGERDNANTKI